MIPTPLVPPSLPPRQPMDAQLPYSTDQWTASMMLTIQAIQRLHAAFDAKFVHPKSNP